MSSVPGVSQPSSQHTDPFSGKSDFAASGPVPADLKEATDLAMGALRAMNEARAQMGIANQGLLPKKCIYLVSKTKSGKTTLANILAGKAVTAQKRAGTWSLIAPDPMPGFTISSRKGSETTIPRVCQCKNPDEMADAVALVDLPGLDDTRGVIQEIANAVCMQKVFEECPQGKILVLVDENYVTNPRGGGLVNCMTMITDLFPGGVERIAKSVSLVVTRVKPGFTVTHMQKNIDNVIRDCLLSPAAAQLLGILKNRMALFKLPTVEGPYDTTQTVADIFASLDTAAFAQDLRVNTHLSADGQLAAAALSTRPLKAICCSSASPTRKTDSNHQAVGGY